MFRWAQQALADVAGTQEPIYGPEAIKSVAEETKQTPYTELTRDDLKWKAPNHTCVETETFYFSSGKGHIAMIQVLYNNVAGLHTTCQFNSKIFYLDRSKAPIWCSTPLQNQEFSEDMTNYYADGCAVELSEDGKSISIKSVNDPNSIINLKITRETPGFHVGTTGTSLFGTDPSNPWGTMRHAFWPRCVGEGTITTPDGTIEFSGGAMFVYALQGMKPHHACARWNFAYFLGPTTTAIVMEFTTPPSYGSTVVPVGAVVKGDKIIYAGSGLTSQHVETKDDKEVGWPEPTKIKFTWSGESKDGVQVDALLEGEYGERLDRIDVMSEVPGFIKSIVGGVAGTKPFIYQYSPPKKLTLQVKNGAETYEEEGDVFAEATFICS